MMDTMKTMMDMMNRMLFAVVATANKHGSRPIDILRTTRLRLAYGTGIHAFDNITRDKGARETLTQQYVVVGE